MLSKKILDLHIFTEIINNSSHFQLISFLHPFYPFIRLKIFLKVRTVKQTEEKLIIVDRNLYSLLETSNLTDRLTWILYNRLSCKLHSR